MAARYALYFAPEPDSPLDHFGQIALDPQAPWAEQSGSARHYGFHATLTSPFELAEGARLEDLETSFYAFSTRHSAVELPGLAPRTLSGHTALTCKPQPSELVDLHSHLVRAFLAFRAPLSQADRERRNPERLSERQRVHLETYGYPYVFEDFQFHMTLAKGPVPQLANLYETLVGDAPQFCNRLALFHQPDRKTAFRPLHAAPLAGE